MTSHLLVGIDVLIVMGTRSRIHLRYVPRQRDWFCNLHVTCLNGSLLPQKGSPIILLHFMVQQINCVRKKEDGTIVEGSEDDIRANSYVAAFQREFRESEGELVWKIVDFRFNGAIAYI